MSTLNDDVRGDQDDQTQSVTHNGEGPRPQPGPFAPFGATFSCSRWNQAPVIIVQ